MNPSVAVEISSHHHYTIQAFFVIGYLLHVWVQIQAQAASKSNSAKTEWQILKTNGSRLAIRFFASLCLFMWLWRDPSTFSDIAKVLGLQPGPTATAIMTVPMSPWFAGGFGLAADVLLTFIPGLKKRTATSGIDSDRDAYYNHHDHRSGPPGTYKGAALK